MEPTRITNSINIQILLQTLISLHIGCDCWSTQGLESCDKYFTVFCSESHRAKFNALFGLSLHLKVLRKHLLPSSFTLAEYSSFWLQDWGPYFLSGCSWEPLSALIIVFPTSSTWWWCTESFSCFKLFWVFLLLNFFDSSQKKCFAFKGLCDWAHPDNPW